MRYTELHGRTYFSAIHPSYGEELWSTDGTDAGTQLAVDVVPGPQDGMPAFWDFGPVAIGNDVALFQAEDDEHGGELWRTDGTPAGTTLLKDINPGFPPSILAVQHDSAVLDGVLYFFPQNRDGMQLWRSDGTESGTYPLTHWDNHPYVPSRLAVLGHRVVFDVFTRDHELMRVGVTDGTPQGTRVIKAFPQGLPPNLWSSDFTLLGDALYFAAADDEGGAELWKTDGTEAGTQRVVDIVPGPQSSSPRGLKAYGSRLVFSANDGVHGEEPWITDGTAAGTHLVKDIVPGPESSVPTAWREAAGYLFFGADDVIHGREPWRTDGTEAGTVMLADIAPGRTPSIYSSEGFSSIEAAGELVFLALDPAHGQELWRSDGTSLGTRLLSDVYPGPLGSGSYIFARHGSQILFTGVGQDIGWELFAYDLPALSVKGGTGREGGWFPQAVPFEITLANAGDRPVTVRYETVDGTAIAGRDYVAQAGMVTFPVGTTSRTVYVPVIDDPRREPAETFSLRLTGAKGAVLDVAQATGLIEDDDR
jgi:ELWxxDGT repeat protein